MGSRRSRTSGSRGKATKGARRPVRKAGGRAPAARGRRGTSGKRRARRTGAADRWRRLKQVAYWGGVAAVWCALILGGLIFYVTSSLPDPVLASLDKRPPNLTILASNGRVLAERGLRRGHIRLSQLPPFAIDAVLATEDRRFYSHLGVDPIGLARAAVRNAWAGRVVEGGSTISQQLAKNLFLKPERTLARKFQEMILAIWLETKFSKTKILELYLNRVYFGAGAYGIEAAARRYFGKSARHVTLSEAALLAGLLKAPSRYAPTSSARRAEARAAVVIESMVRARMLSPAQAVAALAAPARVRNPSGITGYEYAVDWVVELLPGFIGQQQRDLIVETTIDAGLQRKAQERVRLAMARTAVRLKAGEAAAVVMDRRGAIKALVGGRSYKRSQFNRAVKAYRQPGSAFKPFVYLAALESGMTPDTLASDRPVTVNGWRPKNYRNRYRGRITLRESLAQSSNTVAVRLTLEVGRWRVVRTARRLGIGSPLHTRPSIALGTAEVNLLELTSAYAPFANGGKGVLPHIIKRVTTSRGKVVYERHGSGPGRVVAHPFVGAMNEMMNATLMDGTGKQAALAYHPAGGKTGTTQNFRDAWFIGHTSHLVAGVWVGNDDGRPMKQVTGGTLPARIWKAIMTEAHANRPVRALPGTRAAVVARSGPDGAPRSVRRDGAEPRRPLLKRMLNALAPQS
ncbi:MAG: PBP1A family penicillin-binding protein [Hyphomicrobiales bacterium]|nr:PBP1A family penicillin-binding protein [Hyphomicrobiales bacterium]